MKYQLIALDEYRTTAIVGTFDDVSKAVDTARNSVTDANVRNALTQTERERNWEAYFVDFYDGAKLDKNLVYAGNLPDGSEKALLFDKDGTYLVEVADDADARVYLGEVEDGEPWYLSDHKGNFITDLSNENLVGKTMYYIQAI